LLSALSHYRIVRKIGAGGMGEVYLAEDTRLDRKVALKILPAEFAENTDRMNRFVREAKSASALNHPNIITIYEIGEADGTHFIATEFIDGKTLSEYAKANPVNYRLALEVAIQVASALDEAHSAGIVHRDIKPDNVMVRANGLVKILDFGIAKLPAPATTDEEAATAIQSTSPGMVIGTANYMSPEQAKGRDIDARTDIFSFGVVLYELIAGHQPFEGENGLEMIGAILKDEPKPLNADVPVEIQKIIGKCLRKDREERYQTIRDVGNDLKEVKQELEVRNLMERSLVPNEDENKTQILPATTADKLNRTTNQTVVTNLKAKYLAIGLLIMLLAGGGFFGYKYLSPTNKQIESIAVMPFVNESGNSEVEYLSDGMTETLIKSLSQLPNLAVKSRSTVFYYKGKESSPKKIGEELNVQAVLLGRVGGRGDNLKLNLELVNTNTQDVIWSEQYDRKQSDLVSLQSDIARDVSTKLKTKLSGTDEAKVMKSYTTDSEAYQLYLKGRFHWTKRTYDDILKAIEHFKAAVEKDDGFALAYSGLADSYSILPYYRGSKSSEFMKQAKPYAIRAVEIDDQLAEAHTALAFVNEGMWNWGEAEKEYKRAIELNPNYSTAQMRYARFEVRAPRRDVEGLARMKRALELEPSSLVINDNLSQIYLAQGDADSALEQAKRTVELDPRFSFGWVDLTYAYLKKGQTAEAFAAAEKVVEVAKRSTRSLICLGFVNAVLGRRSEAMAILKELEEKYQNGQSDATEVAAVYVGLGDKDQAFIWLDKAFADRSSLLVDLRAEFPFASLRDDPRYKNLLKRMNLPE
jgi:serine/threonine-protein kinase